MSRRRRSLALAAIVATATVVIAGCSVVESSAESAARAAVAELARDIAHHRGEDIDAWARHAERAAGDGGAIELIGIDTEQPAVLGDPQGALRFRMTSRVENVGLFAAGSQEFTGCYAVHFTYYGPDDHGERWSDRGLARAFRCPPDAAAIAAPEEPPGRRVIPDGAAEAIIAALTEVDGTRDPRDIAAAVDGRIPAPADSRHVAAPVDVAVTDPGSIGVAMGDGDRCILVKKVDGVIEQVFAPSVLTRPGELGCVGTTALAADLRPPH